MSRCRCILVNCLLSLSFWLAAPAFAVAEPIEVTAESLPLDPTDPARNAVGPFAYRGGLVLTSPDPRFGGLSALGVSADGARMLSLSDQGTSFSARLVYDSAGNLSGLRDGDLGPLSDRDGTPLRGKRWTDAEAMSPGVGGEIIVAFERDHRIWRYDPGVTVPRVLKPPPELADMKANSGIEALTLLNDGRLLAMAEGSPDEDATVAWVSRTGGWDVMTYHTGDGFRPTGAATLPEGDVLVLERYYTPRNGVRIRIKRLAKDTISAGAELKAPILADFVPPLSIDNFEGIEARQGAAGEALVYLISDNNFSDSQRTLLLMFALRR